MPTSFLNNSQNHFRVVSTRDAPIPNSLRLFPNHGLLFLNPVMEELPTNLELAVRRVRTKGSRCHLAQTGDFMGV